MKAKSKFLVTLEKALKEDDIGLTDPATGTTINPAQMGTDVGAAAAKVNTDTQDFRKKLLALMSTDKEAAAALKDPTKLQNYITNLTKSATSQTGVTPTTTIQ